MSEGEWIEAEGGTVDEAVESALGTLGARRAEVEVEILTEPSRGLFGLGGRRARVRVGRRRSLESTASPRAGRSEDRSPSPMPEAVVDHAREVLEGLLRRMGFESGVTVVREDGAAILDVAGDNTNVVIGKHGQTLDALEYILNRIVSREEESATRIQLDCEQYRAKRRRSLEDLAHRMAEQATRSGRSVALDAMSPRDRRIVHLALQNAPGLTTRSSGEGYHRRLVIIPEGERQGRGRGR